MTSDPQDSASIVRLLACKRHEQPPPRYFSSFSGRVIAQIENEQMVRRSGWLEWISQKMEMGSLLACSYSVAVFGLLFLGYKMADATDPGREEGRTPGGLRLSTSTTPLRDSSSESWAGSSLFDAVVPVYAASYSPAYRPEVPGIRWRNSEFRVHSASLSPGF